jgi:hypothetical protein
MNIKIIGASLLVVSLCASSGRCQQSSDAGDATLFLNMMGPGTLDSPVGGIGNAVEVTASNDSGNATVKLSRSLSTPQNSSFSTFTLTASAPIDKSSDRTDLATLDGLRNAFTLGTKLTWFRMSGRRNFAGDQKLVDKRDEICGELQRALKLPADTEPDCGIDLVKKNLPNRYVEYRQLLIDPDGWLVSYGVEPKVGYKKFTFLDGTTLSKMSDSKEPWSVEAFIGFAPSKSQTLITIGGNYQSGFKDADSGILCPPLSGSGPIACKTGPVGKPVSDDAELLYVEIRHQFGWAGISLRATHDFKESLTGVDLPIIFIKGPDGGLTGGVRVGWNSTSHWQAGIFVGKAFSLFDS